MWLSCVVQLLYAIHIGVGHNPSQNHYVAVFVYCYHLWSNFVTFQ